MRGHRTASYEYSKPTWNTGIHIDYDVKQKQVRVSVYEYNRKNSRNTSTVCLIPKDIWNDMIDKVKTRTIKKT